MNTIKAVLALTLATGVVACKGHDDSTSKAAADPAAWKLDDSKLTPSISFSPNDLDASKNACTDLAAYVNDKWLAANPIPSDRASWGPFAALAERSLDVRHQIAEHAATEKSPGTIDKIIADFWTSGMDDKKIEQLGISPLKSRLDAIAALSDGKSIADYLRKTAAEGENPLFDFDAEADFKNSSMNIAYATQGGLGLPDRNYYFDDDKKDIREAYEKHIAKVLELSGIDAKDAAEQAKTVMAFETRLAKVSKSQEEMSRDVSLYYNPVSPADADKLTPNFPWTAFFASQGVPAPTMFSLAMPAFHEEVSKMLADVPAAQWQSYLRYHLVDSASPYLSKAFVDEYFEFHRKTLGGQKEQRARWKRVIGAIESNAGEAMGQLYVKVAFPPESKTQMETLVGNLRTALKARIENLSWMSDETKKKALEKWAAFTPKIGYPDKWRDWSGLKTQPDDYLGNALAADKFNYEWQLSKIGKPVDKTEWSMTPQTVNAYYNPLQNEIVFPAAILQPPFFDPNADAAFNYGAIGSVIGHEMTHGYDDQGSRFGPDGNFEDWWTKDDRAKFNALTDKLIAQFNGYTTKDGVKVNGKLTLGENIADLGGINVAYDAMQAATAGQPDDRADDLTRDQRFFIGWATAWRGRYTPELEKVIIASDPHAPDNFRADGPPSNMPVFAQAFDCKAGDPMVRSEKDRISIW
ncbi:M13 family metallopeptidase [Solimonas marina]|uniref:Peptidase n=1 Tax=Solimonas marina TaxID=2714601 RepID=A0A969WB76_9GAMM|nr:M13-type metalloendopeptidase [Solimonas marina]NKF23338.1 peptidase [Solimonas marina]